MVWQGPVAAGVWSYLKDVALENVKLCQDQICAFKAFGGPSQIQDPRVHLVRASRVPHGSHGQDQVRSEDGTISTFPVRKLPFLPGVATCSEPIEKQACRAPEPGLASPEDKQGREGRDSLAWYRQPLSL